MRSEFLTLLCILTFLSCSWGLFDSTVSYLQTDAVAEPTEVKRTYTPEEKKTAPKQYYEDRSSGNAPLPEDPDQIRLLAVAQFLYSLITLAGAILMFQLRRIGYWIYIAGTVVGVLTPVILAGFGALNTSFGVFFSMLFAGLYWLTLKEMR